MDKTASKLKPVEELYSDKIEAGILMYPRKIVALTEPLNEIREPVGPALYRYPKPTRDIKGKRYILVMDAQANFANSKPFRASDDKEAIDLANDLLAGA